MANIRYIEDISAVLSNKDACWMNLYLTTEIFTMLSDNFCKDINYYIWLANSSDYNHLDYYLWRAVQLEPAELIVIQTYYDSIQQLKQ